MARRLGGSLPITLHGRAELVNSVALAVFRGDITAAIGDSSLADFETDLEESRLWLADVPWRKALDRAAELSRTHTPKLGTRTLDVLHVASALTIGSKTFVTYDDRQAALARAVGLRLLRP